MKLSICVVTMNRANQLKEALESCLACELAENTEFVIIDNASTDDTEATVRTTLEHCGYRYYYEKLSENLGVGGGRNYAYKKACGEYVYMLDDDAVIDIENNRSFFISAVNMLDKYSDVVSLTTQIYDTAWGKNRLSANGVPIHTGLHKCIMFCGGSHFLRKSFYKTEPYLPNKYGYEEIPSSLRAMDAGKVNAFCPELCIIHKPVNNKWNWDDEKNHALLINEIAFPYAIKKMMYPSIARPLLLLAKNRRIGLHLGHVKDAKMKVNAVAMKFCKEYPIEGKISIKTLCRMFRDFKLSVF